MPTFTSNWLTDPGVLVSQMSARPSLVKSPIAAPLHVDHTSTGSGGELAANTPPALVHSCAGPPQLANMSTSPSSSTSPKATHAQPTMPAVPLLADCPFNDATNCTTTRQG